MADSARYRFEPLDRRGLLLGLGAGQLAVAAVGLLGALLTVTTWPGAAGLAGATGCAALAVALCRPVSGFPPARWAGVALGFLSRRRFASTAPPACALPAGATRASWDTPTLSFPSRTFVPGTYLSQLPATADDGAIGVLLDEREGTASALLRARGAAFCLLDEPDKARCLDAWAAVLESLTGPRSTLVRLQWCQRAVVGDSESLVAKLRAVGAASAPGLSAHADLVEKAGPRSWRHETLLVVSVMCRGRRGRPHADGAEALRNEVRSLRAQMGGAGLVCEGVLDAPGVARAIAASLVPVPSTATRAHPWPLSFEEHWSALRIDGLWHRTYWVAEWPRSPVGPDFLSPLLTSRHRRSFSVVMAPVPPERAVRDAESSRTAQMADAHLRAQGGFLETARHRRQAEAVEGRERQLADGRAAFTFSGYVTVSAPGRPGLEEACAGLERAAAAARLRLRPVYGQQREALSWALPLGRGV